MCNWVRPAALYPSHSSEESLKENKDIIKSGQNLNRCTLLTIRCCSPAVMIQRDYGGEIGQNIVEFGAAGAGQTRKNEDMDVGSAGGTVLDRGTGD